MRLSGISLAIALFVAATVQADTILDQIGPNANDLVANSPNPSQLYGGNNSKYDSAVIDKFTIGSSKTLTEVDAAFLGSTGFVSYANVTSWEVEIYSTVAKAASNLTGDIASINVAAASVTVTTPFGGDSYSALIQVPISKTIVAGTYYVAVIANSGYPQNGELGVYESTYAGSGSEVLVNPGGGYGYSNDQYATGKNAAYRILGTPAVAVPEPSSLILTANAAVGGLVLALRRLRRRDLA